jgi:hypothetical protein
MYAYWFYRYLLNNAYKWLLYGGDFNYRRATWMMILCRWWDPWNNFTLPLWRRSCCSKLERITLSFVIRFLKNGCYNWFKQVHKCLLCPEMPFFDPVIHPYFHLRGSTFVFLSFISRLPVCPKLGQWTNNT